MGVDESFALDPIDTVEQLAEHNEWNFDRIDSDQIAMTVAGQWRIYSITLAWSAYDETLRLICTYEIELPEERLSELYVLLNNTNDQCWAGSFTYWGEQKLMVYRYSLVLTGGQTAAPEQIDTMIAASIMSAERYYPAFQLVAFSDKSAAEALQITIAEAYGHA